jgi:hypothetical protein
VTLHDWLMECANERAGVDVGHMVGRKVWDVLTPKGALVLVYDWRNGELSAAIREYTR